MKKTLGTIASIIVAIVFMGCFVAVNYTSAEENQDGRFISYDDGTVLDTETNLLWAARDNGKDISWEEAKAYCENYQGGDYKAWRLPTKDELKKLHDKGIFGNNGYHVTKLITLTGAFLWSSKLDGSEASVYSFGHDYGLWMWDTLRTQWRNRVLAVRTGREGKVVVIEPKPAPAPAPVAAPVKEKVTVTLLVEFDNDKAIVKDTYYDDIKTVADFMKEYPDTVAAIDGHTDSNASNVYNQKLSERRANAVRQYLIDKFGINGSRLTATGYGEERPVATNDTAEGRQKNRRVEAVLEAVRIKK